MMKILVNAFPLPSLRLISSYNMTETIIKCSYSVYLYIDENVRVVKLID